MPYHIRQVFKTWQICSLIRDYSDYYVEHDWASIAQEDASRDRLLDDFLNQRLAVIRGLDTSGLDFSFLETVRFPQTWNMKKFQFKALVADWQRGHDTELVCDVLQNTFHGDRARFGRFAEQMAIVQSLAEQFVGRVLGHLTLGQTIMVARFSETRMENLHYDLDAQSDDHEAFRFYINLDAYPRIWNTSYQVTELLETGGRRLLDGIDANERAEVILKRATSRAFGGWNQRATERRAPHHKAFFDPGDAWLVDGRSVSHQVLSGHRVLSTYVRIPHAGNEGLGPTFAEKVRSAFAKGMARPAGEETAEVNYFGAGTITAAANLKEDWSTVFGDTRTGGVRRFDDRGLVSA